MSAVDQDLMTQMKAEGLLTDADIAAMTSTEAAAVTEVIELDDSTVLHVTDAIEADESRALIYAAQGVGTDLVENTVHEIVAEGDFAVVEAAAVDDGAAAVPSTKGAKARAKKASTGAGRRVSRVVSSGTLGAYAAGVAGSTLALVEGSDDTVDTATLINSINAKKVQEKAVNLIDARYAGKRLSVFTQIAVRTLKDAGKLTAKTLADLYQNVGSGKSYSPGTARSQAQQMTALLVHFGLASKSGSELVANDQSTFLKAL
jgi:hypothetical protein